MSAPSLYIESTDSLIPVVTKIIGTCMYMRVSVFMCEFCGDTCTNVHVYIIVILR